MNNKIMKWAEKINFISLLCKFIYKVFFLYVAMATRREKAAQKSSHIVRFVNETHCPQELGDLITLSEFADGLLYVCISLLNLCAGGGLYHTADFI